MSCSLLSTTFTNPTGTPCQRRQKRTFLHEVFQAEQRRGRVSDGKDAGLLKLRRFFHRHERPRHAAPLRLLRNVRIRHEAVDRAAEAFQHRFVDAGARHLRVGDDIAAGFERLDSFLHSVRGKDKIVRVVKVRGGVDGALDHKRIFRVQLTVPQKLGDDLEAARFNVHGFQLFRHGGKTPFGRRPENGRQRLDWRKMKVREARVERIGCDGAGPAPAGRLFGSKIAAGLFCVPVVKFMGRNRLPRAAKEVILRGGEHHIAEAG